MVHKAEGSPNPGLQLIFFAELERTFALADGALEGVAHQPSRIRLICFTDAFRRAIFSPTEEPAPDQSDEPGVDDVS